MAKKNSPENSEPIDDDPQDLSQSDEFAAPDDRRGGNHPKPLSTEDCLLALSKLPGLVALRALKPAECNAIRTVYGTMLGHYSKQQSQPNSIPVGDDVFALLRSHPELIDSFAPLLAPEQMDALMREFTDDQQAD